MPDAAGANCLTLLQGAQAFFGALVQDIDAASCEVRLETYIFDFHASAEQVAWALLAAASRGVQVYVAIDGAGTPALPRVWRQRFDAAGVHWLLFAPLGAFELGLLRPSRWRRLHRKLCCIDARLAYCGGINILDDYWQPRQGALPAPRLDFVVRIKGPLVLDIHVTMSRFWRWRHAHTGTPAPKPPPVSLVQPDRLWPEPVAQPVTKAQLVLRDNVRYRSHIERAYSQALHQARQEVILASAYFFPSRKIRRSLIHAARRGVRVRLLLQGRYDYFLSYHGGRALFGLLLANGIEIYQYQSSFLHAKVAVVDGYWATVGSSNIDPLSLRLAREANIIIHDVTFAATLRQALEQAIEQNAVRLDQQQHARRSLGQKLLDRVALLLLYLLLLLTGKHY